MFVAYTMLLSLGLPLACFFILGHPLGLCSWNALTASFMTQKMSSISFRSSGLILALVSSATFLACSKLWVSSDLWIARLRHIYFSKEQRIELAMRYRYFHWRRWEGRMLVTIAADDFSASITCASFPMLLAFYCFGEIPCGVIERR